MKNNIIELASYRFSSGESILLDTNVWLYLFPASGRSTGKVVQDYSSAFGRMRSSGAHLLLEPTVLSEYVNRYARIEWNARHGGIGDFKKFRQSSSFTPVGQAIAVNAKRILGFCKPCDVLFSSFNINGILADFEAGALDFNDGILVEICKNTGSKLVTNDADFREGGIDVLTTNPTLLKN